MLKTKEDLDSFIDRINQNNTVKYRGLSYYLFRNNITSSYDIMFSRNGQVNSYKVLEGGLSLKHAQKIIFTLAHAYLDCV